MHNLEKKPRTHLIGVRWGYGGVIVGVASAVIAIVANWTAGNGSAYEVGISMGRLLIENTSVGGFQPGFARASLVPADQPFYPGHELVVAAAGLL